MLHGHLRIVYDYILEINQIHLEYETYEAPTAIPNGSFNPFDFKSTFKQE